MAFSVEDSFFIDFDLVEINNENLYQMTIATGPDSTGICGKNLAHPHSRQNLMRVFCHRPGDKATLSARKYTAPEVTIPPAVLGWPPPPTGVGKPSNKFAKTKHYNHFFLPNKR
ncbi:MAG: hypothetical protein MPK62_04570 [Alphaproteobacteria bacterium]|nr:hypothetical protein [Alphaproteobacteria bacterium]